MDIKTVLLILALPIIGTFGYFIKAYIGKIKFNNQIFEGGHQPIISSTLFNHVQDKLERLGIK